MSDRLTTTRRGLIRGGAYAAGAAIVGTGLALADEAQGATHNAISPRLARLIALHQQATDVLVRYEDEVSGPAHFAWRKACDAYPAETPPPHEESAASFANVFGERRRLSTANAAVVAVASRVVNDPDWADLGDEEWRQAHREIAAAGERRQAIIDAQTERRRTFEAETAARFRVRETQRRHDQLCERASQIDHAVMTFPAGNLADLAAKTAFFMRWDEEDSDFAPLAADIRRLNGEG